MATYQAYGTTTPGMDIQELTLKQRELRPNELLLRVISTGICSSDIHQITADWSTHGVNLYNNSPHIVPGHEAVSCVIGMGSAVPKDAFNIGDIVLCGPQRSCECYEQKLEVKCKPCENQNEQLCTNGIGKLYNGPETGSFGSYLTCSTEFCFKVPNEMWNNEENRLKLGPLACAGLTTFSPLFQRQLPAGSDVAVIGIGGLGLMAVSYAVAMNYNVTALTTSSNKKEQLLAMGVKRVINYKTEDMPQYFSSLDLILNTVSAPIDTNTMLKLLRPCGELVYMGLGNDNIVINPFALVGTNKRVSGSFIGGTKDFKAMLEFSAKHNIYPICEVINAPFSQEKAKDVSEAVQKVHRGDVRYRMVLDYQVNLDQVVADAKKAQEQL